MRGIIWAVALTLSFSVIARTDDLSKVPVSVSQSGHDQVGERFAFAVRERIRASSGYQLVDYRAARVNISIITMDPEDGSEYANHMTAASIAFTITNNNRFEKWNPESWYPVFLTHIAIVVGSQQLSPQADGVIASLDSALQDFRNDAQKGSTGP